MGARLIVAIVAVGLLAALFVLRLHVPVGSPPAGADRPPARATHATPTDQPAHKDSVTKAPGSSARLLDADLFFLAALDSHRGRGAANSSGGLGHTAR